MAWKNQFGEQLGEGVNAHKDRFGKTWKYSIKDPRTGKHLEFKSNAAASAYYATAKSTMGFGDRQLQENARQYNSSQNFRQNSYAQERNDDAEGYGLQVDTANQGYGEMLEAWNENTGQRAADIRSAYHDKEATGMQALARTGMSNTTIAPTMKLGYERESQEALNRDADVNLKTKLGILEGRTNSLQLAHSKYSSGYQNK